MSKALSFLWSRILDATQLTCCGVLVLMVLTTGYDTIARYLGMQPTNWSTEVNSFLIVYVTAISAAAILRSHQHISITFFAEKLPAGVQAFIRLAEGLLGCLFSLLIAWHGFFMAYNAYLYDETVSSSFGTPLVYPYAIIPIGFLLLAIQFLLNAINFRAPIKAGET
ncbi:MAG: TRAP transporter small permease [Alcaligenaceae bacterium]|nr:TRAP transporter small permease [Alcaligenaceae bacterium]